MQGFHARETTCRPFQEGRVRNLHEAAWGLVLAVGMPMHNQLTAAYRCGTRAPERYNTSVSLSDMTLIHRAMLYEAPESMSTLYKI